MLRERRPSAQATSNEPAQATVASVPALLLEALHLADRAEAAATTSHLPPDASFGAAGTDSHRVDAFHGQVLCGQTVFVKVAVFPCISAAHFRRVRAYGVAVVVVARVFGV
jgi:hypothetical protein